MKWNQAHVFFWQIVIYWRRCLESLVRYHSAVRACSSAGPARVLLEDVRQGLRELLRRKASEEVEALVKAFWKLFFECTFQCMFSPRSQGLSGLSAPHCGIWRRRQLKGWPTCSPPCPDSKYDCFLSLKQGIIPVSSCWASGVPLTSVQLVQAWACSMLSWVWVWMLCLWRLCKMPWPIWCLALADLADLFTKSWAPRTDSGAYNVVIQRRKLLQSNSSLSNSPVLLLGAL